MAAVDLDQEMDDELDAYTWEWVTVGDDRVCPDCEALEKKPSATYTEWTQNRTEPGRGDTICGDRCRCIMVPVDIIKAGTDLTRQVVLNDPKLIVSPDDAYELFDELDDLIESYKAATEGKKLPDMFYEIPDVAGRIGYLEDWLKGAA